MNNLRFLLTITNRAFIEKYNEFYNERGIASALSCFAKGTASKSTLDYLGLEDTDKVMFCCMVIEDEIEQIKKDLTVKMNIVGAGNGIAIFLPIDSVGGEWALKQLIGDKPFIKGEDKKMNESLSKLVLITIIVDKGNTDTVMETARSAGATGGTVVKAKGTGTQMAKFFGVSISEEKEMIYIVAKRENRDNIMRAIMEKAGKNTDAHAIVFTLPVESVCGISGLND